MQEKLKLISLLKEIYAIWIKEKPTQYAAALAYYAIFSFVPVIYIVFTLAEYFGSRFLISDLFYNEISTLLGDQTASYIKQAVASLAQRTTGDTTILSIIGIITMIFSASFIFYQLQHVLHTIWQIEPPTKNAARTAIRNRLFSFIMVLGVFLLFIITTLVSLTISTIEKLIEIHLVASLTSFLAVAVLATLSAALIYKLLPNVRIAWKDVFIGASVVGLLVASILKLLGSYFLRNRFNSPIDAAGSITILLVTFYFLGQIFILGAVVTRVYANMFGKGITSNHIL